MQAAVLAHLAHGCRVQGSIPAAWVVRRAPLSPQDGAMRALAQRVLLASRRLVALVLGYCWVARRSLIRVLAPLLSFLRWWLHGGIYAPAGKG